MDGDEQMLHSFEVISLNIFCFENRKISFEQDMEKGTFQTQKIECVHEKNFG